jgi:hypothetical protein
MKDAADALEKADPCEATEEDGPPLCDPKMVDIDMDETKAACRNN